MRKLSKQHNGEGLWLLNQHHIDDFHALMGRVHLNIGEPSMNSKPTDRTAQSGQSRYN